MPYTTYIFDLDGTLLDTLQDLANAVNYSMRTMKYPERTLDEVRRFIGDGMKMLIRRAVPAETGEEDCEKALALFREYYNAHLCDCTTVYGGMGELISTLKADGKKLAVVSNKADDASNAVVHHFFGDSFDIVLGRREDFPPKPEPDSVLYVMKQLGSDTAECIYIGDSDTDVDTAHNAGLPCIGVTWGNRERRLLEEKGAEFIVDSPEEIPDI